MKLAAVLTLLAGLAVATLLVVHFGAGEVGKALRAAGWSGLAVISLVHLGLIALTGFAWWSLVGGPREAPGPWTFVWGRLMRDAGAEILPLSQVGGFVLGARAVILHGVGGTVAAASMIADVTVEMLAQMAYTALGLVLLLWLRPGTTLAYPILIGLALAAIAAAIFVAVQRRRISFLDRAMARLARGWLAAIAANAEAVQAEIRAIYRHRRGLRASFFLHLLAWVATGAETWLAFRLLGVAPGFGPVLVIESLLYAVRSAAFVVPNAIGVQEGAYVMLGAAFGVTPEVALAWSLLKRARDLALGVPPLLVWQYVEARQLWKHRSAAQSTIDRPADSTEVSTS